MTDFTVKTVARLSGVSVRTLHHYDEIGLLKPARVGANGYRYYGREDLLRLQQVLFHRELGMPLAAIAALLDDPGFDRVAALRSHRDRLRQQVDRGRQLIETIDATLADLQGETKMDETKMYLGFEPETQARHEAWLTERYGGDMGDRVAQSKAGLGAMGPSAAQNMIAQGEALEAEFARALQAGAPADSEATQALARRWCDWIARAWNRAPDRAAFDGLSRLYEDHPEFRARYEARCAGLTEYLGAAMRAFAERELA
ncbi:MAG: MerR family transcriptional regulator [Phenylobacterium sp.]|uniref:MerR family transcriptional regulator n=1 Tax=Phenylobacterium sp. TaxID=1871053 RepID=UPI00271F4C6D|nr:MerR family transcriptional regulator [Phenylobacterium sp.]MDO8901419.1 MerR family transcriptional regulator [Phenylobacterium sp.]